MVRRHVILCNFDPLRAIVLRDRLLVIVPEGADGLLADLERRVHGGMDEYEKSVFGDTEGDDGDDDAAGTISTSVQRYTKKPNGPLGTKKMTNAVKNTVKHTANRVKKAIGRNTNHNSAPTPPLTTTPATTSTEKSTTTSSGQSSARGFAQLETSEWEDLQGNDWKELSFELQCVDGTYM